MFKTLPRQGFFLAMSGHQKTARSNHRARPIPCDDLRGALARMMSLRRGIPNAAEATVEQGQPGREMALNIAGMTLTPGLASAWAGRAMSLRIEGQRSFVEG
jgi:hypothetical protein